MNILSLTKFGETKLSLIKNPFSKNKITAIHVHYTKSMFTENWSARGSVKFANGNTNGEQEFDGKTFDEVVEQMKMFVRTLDSD